MKDNGAKGTILWSMFVVLFLGVINSYLSPFINPKNPHPLRFRLFIGAAVVYTSLAGLAQSKPKLAKDLAVLIMTTAILTEGAGVVAFLLARGQSDNIGQAGKGYGRPTYWEPPPVPTKRFRKGGPKGGGPASGNPFSIPLIAGAIAAAIAATRKIGKPSGGGGGTSNPAPKVGPGIGPLRFPIPGRVGLALIIPHPDSHGLGSGYVVDSKGHRVPGAIGWRTSAGVSTFGVPHSLGGNTVAPGGSTGGVVINIPGQGPAIPGAPVPPIPILVP